MADMLGATIVEETAVELNRQCRIELGPNRTTPLALPWNLMGKKTVFVLSPVQGGKRMCVVPLERAQAWFGFFTLERAIDQERDPKRKNLLLNTYREERERALNTWGDYPRPRKLSEGTEPIGPHRFPDVICTVIEQDGTEWDPIRLHEQYRIGDFDTLQFNDPIAEQNAALETERAERSKLDLELAEMKGQMKALLVTVGGAKK